MCVETEVPDGPYPGLIPFARVVHDQVRRVPHGRSRTPRGRLAGGKAPHTAPSATAPPTESAKPRSIAIAREAPQVRPTAQLPELRRRRQSAAGPSRRRQSAAGTTISSPRHRQSRPNGALLPLLGKRRRPALPHSPQKCSAAGKRAAGPSRRRQNRRRQKTSKGAPHPLCETPLRISVPLSG